ncbi:MAG: winged helix-turn-helix transcriptional regulator [Candidatus Thermoplasmatota archaeon]
MKHRFVVAIIALVALAPTAAALDLTVGIRHGLLPVDVEPIKLAVEGPDAPSTAAHSSSQSSHSRSPLPDVPSLPPPPIVVDFNTVNAVVDTSLGLVGTTIPQVPRGAPAQAPEPPAMPERIYVGHESPAKASAIAPGAALVALAAVTAAGPVIATLSWERLRRFAPLAMLYTRIAKERLLDHGARERLIEAVRSSPGVALADAARIADLPRNTAVYHLMRLEKEGLVSSLRRGRTRLYFAPGALDQRENASAIAALRHPVTLDIATEVGAKPGLDQQALCQRFGIAPSLAHWHAARLVDAGIVTAQREGRRVRYYPGASYAVVRTRTA